MSLSNRIFICSFKCGLQLFEALGMYCMFAIEVIMINERFLVDDMGLKKVKYLLFYI